MTRKPAAPGNTRNGLKWRDGRPRWEPSPANRACGFRGADLRDDNGRWMDRGQAISAADARTLWASVVRAAMQDDDAGGKARADLRRALDGLPPMPTEPEARRRRELIADLIEAGRAALDDREPDVAAAVAPRSVAAMVDGYFNDTRQMRSLSASTIEAYRVQSGKLKARFGARPADEINRGELREWYLDLVETISPSTANQAAGAAGSIFKWATLQNPPWRNDNPCTQLGLVEAPGRLVFWTPEEERAFIPWCDANGYADVADCAVFGLWTAARQVDICALDMQDVEGRDTWRFTPQKTRRKGQEALPALLAPVKARIERRRSDLNKAPLAHLNAEPFLWDARFSRRHTSDSIGSSQDGRFAEARDAAIKAGAVPATFAAKHLQDTRDTCVTRLWAAGVSLDRIATWGGWSFKTVGEIIRKHYLTLLDDGAAETAVQLEAWAAKNGFNLAAA